MNNKQLTKEIAAVKEGKMEERRKMLGTVRIIGATCNACTFDILQKRTFRLVIMDECSQTIEPLSLLSMAPFKCERAVLVGDPQQLRPVLSSSRILDQKDSQASATGGTIRNEGLAKTMFVRIVNCGINPILLRTQYRVCFIYLFQFFFSLFFKQCHPAISGIASKLFYGGKLLNGITERDREPLVPGLPPVVFCEAADGKVCFSHSNHTTLISFLAVF